jgi:methylenetetrahydrofolate reductase (NADPH)
MANELPFLERVGDKTPISLEILPPNRGVGLDAIHAFIESLGEWRPAFISVTYHQAFKIEENDTRIWNRKKPGTIGVCAMLKFQYGLEVIPHVICGGFSTYESEDFLVDLDYLGLNTILALRGDPRKGDDSFAPHRDGHRNASDLVAQVGRLNDGDYMEDIKESKPTDFTVGVAGYPEKHKECEDSDMDIQNLKNKVDAGASFIITQMFFDNEDFFSFEKRCRSAGITVPIIPGIKILTTKRQIQVLPEIFHINIPHQLKEDILACEDNAAAIQIGIEHSIKQAEELIAHGVPCLHLFSMNNTAAITPLLNEIK